MGKGIDLELLDLEDAKVKIASVKVKIEKYRIKFPFISPELCDLLDDIMAGLECLKEYPKQVKMDYFERRKVFLDEET